MSSSLPIIYLLFCVVCSVNHLDIAPQHASVLMGFSNTFATMSGILSPSVAGYIVQNKVSSEAEILFLFIRRHFNVACNCKQFSHQLSIIHALLYEI